MNSDIAIKASIVLALALAMRTLLASRSAALRHGLLAVALATTALLPLATTLAPEWRVPVLGPSVPATVVPRVEAPRRDHPRVTTSVTRTTAAPTIPLPGAGVFWAVGAALMLCWAAAGRIGLGRMQRRAAPLQDAAWMDILAEAARTTGMSASHVRMFRSAEVSSPMTWGTFRPAIVLPESADDWHHGRRVAVIAHELAHVGRADSAIQIVAIVACAFHWFNPLVWLAWRGLRLESERACDDVVLAGGLTATDYARHLLDIARNAHLMRLGGMTAIGMARTPQLEVRLLAILDEARARWVPSRGARTAWASLALLAWPVAAFSPVHREARPPAAFSSDSTFERTVEARPGGTLDLDLETGATVRITGWDQSSARIRGRLAGPSARQSTVEIAAKDGDVLVAMRQQPTRGTTTTSHELDVQVPHRYDVRINSAGGSLTISNVEGALRGETGGGEITIEGANGRASLSTGGGDVLVRNSSLDGQVSTGGGAVRFQGVKGGLKGSSGSGPVTRGGPEDGGGPIYMEKAGGDIVLPSAPDGARVNTGGGRIRIGMAGGDIRASTGGGDIDIGPVSGSVHATTGAGDVTVRISRLSGDDPAVDISAGVGTVTLELPAGLSAELDIETGYTRSTRRPTIDSPWAVEREETQEWDASQGTPRRHVRATGVIGNGGPIIRVRTLNGDVRLIQR